MGNIDNSFKSLLFFMQKLAEMAEVLEARESRLLELSKENMDLQESNSILRK